MKVQRLRVIYEEVEARTTAIEKTHGAWPCKSGCDHCCRSLSRVPEMTEAEWSRLREGIEALEDTVKEAVYTSISEMNDETRVCPMLDQARGACRVYAHRPASCRSYGFYLLGGDGLWCEKIEALHQEDMPPGLIYGHQIALERTLERAFGPKRTLSQWAKER